MKILFTGASSFTGFWFVKSLAAAGHEVACPTTRSLEAYEGGRRQRMDSLRSSCRFVPEISFGTDGFLKLAGAEKFDLLCHHAADVTNYRSPDFDTIQALQKNTLNARAVLKALQCPVVLTGSVFENDEGSDLGHDGEPLRAFSPYGLSKGLTWQYFRYYCHEAGVPLGKFVIPNPFGPYEEPRFTAHLMRNWKAGTVAEVKTPDYLRDNIPVDLLAAIYLQFCVKVAAGKKSGLKSNPSGYVEKQGEFAQRAAHEVKSRTGWACELNLTQQTDFSEPLQRVNTEPAAKLIPEWNEQKAWDGFVDFYNPVG